mgnify:CR=1 FL=1
MGCDPVGRRALLQSVAVAAFLTPYVKQAGASAGREATVSAGDWPMYGHDPTQRGYIPDGFGPASVDLTWEREFTNWGTSSFRGPSPVIDGDTAYVTGAGDEFHAVDVKTGETKWSLDVTDTELSPAVANGLVYVPGSIESNFEPEYFFAVDAETGEIEWIYRGDRYLSKSTPVVSDGRVYVASWSDLHALDATDGSELWQTERSTVLEERPVTVAGDQVFAKTYYGLQVFDAASGTRNFQTTDVGEGYAVPAVVDGTAYVGAGDRVSAVDAYDGTIEWEVAIDESLIGETAVTDDTVYVGSSEYIYAVGRKSGEPKWKLRPGTVEYAPLVVVGDTLYYTTETNEVRAFDTVELTEQWRYEFDSDVSGPTVSEGRVFCTTTGGDGAARLSDPQISEARGLLSELAETISDAEASGIDVESHRADLARAQSAFDSREFERAISLSENSLVTLRATLDRYEDATRGIDRLASSITEAQADGVPTDDAETALASARVALSNADYETALERVDRGRTLLERATVADSRVTELATRLAESNREYPPIGDRLAAARSALDAGDYDEAISIADGGLALHDTAREAAEAVTALADNLRRVDRSFPQIADRLAAARSALDAGDYDEALSIADEGSARFESAGAAAQSVSELENRSNAAADDGLNLPYVRSQLEAARVALDAGEYESAESYANAGLENVDAARETATLLEAVERQDGVDGVLTPVANALGREELLEGARRAQARGDYRLARRRARAARGKEGTAVTASGSLGAATALAGGAVWYRRRRRQRAWRSLVETHAELRERATRLEERLTEPAPGLGEAVDRADPERFDDLESAQNAVDDLAGSLDSFGSLLERIESLDDLNSTHPALFSRLDVGELVERAERAVATGDDDAAIVCHREVSRVAEARTAANYRQELLDRAENTSSGWFPDELAQVRTKLSTTDVASDPRQSEERLAVLESALDAVVEATEAVDQPYNVPVRQLAADLQEAIEAESPARVDAVRDRAAELNAVPTLVADVRTRLEAVRDLGDLVGDVVDPAAFERELQQAIEAGDVVALGDLQTRLENVQSGTWTTDDLLAYTPEEFERLVAKLWQFDGYDTSVTQLSNDKGIDVTATDGTEEIVIQAKRNAPKNNVGRPTIQKTEGARVQVGADRAVVVTTSDFTTGARDAERDLGGSMELVDGRELLTRLTQSPLPPPRQS